MDLKISILAILTVQINLIMGCDELTEMNDQAKVTEKRTQQNILSRRKRYLVFPEKSVATVSASLVKAIMVTDPSGWNVLIDITTSFPLPTQHYYKKHEPLANSPDYHHVRQRREIHGAFEDLFDRLGLDGPSCVQNLLCQGQQLKEKEDLSMFEEVLLTIFRFENLSTNASENDRICKNMMKKCQISFLDWK